MEHVIRRLPGRTPADGAPPQGFGDRHAPRDCHVVSAYPAPLFWQCLLAGDAHDTAAVFRLVQLWFALGADAGANAALAAALTAVPSQKLLPLAYQMASRVSAAQAGPLVESGFQARAACKRTCALISTSDHQTTVHCRAMLLFLLEY